MIDTNCLREISENHNPGIEYEIGLLYALCDTLGIETARLKKAIMSRGDVAKIDAIIKTANPKRIFDELAKRKLSVTDVSLETQNDAVGPADIVLNVTDQYNENLRLGLSVKYANSCSINITGRRFLSQSQSEQLLGILPQIVEEYVAEMNTKYGSIGNWFRMRRRSDVTDRYIDMIRDCVIVNWESIEDKDDLIKSMYQIDSPIPYWIVRFSKRGYNVNTSPVTLDANRIGDIRLGKYGKSYIGFYIGCRMIGKIQVKFNNGIVEKCVTGRPDMIVQDMPIRYGKPLSSWNFSTVR